MLFCFPSQGGCGFRLGEHKTDSGMIDLSNLLESAILWGGGIDYYKEPDCQTFTEIGQLVHDFKYVGNRDITELRKLVDRKIALLEQVFSELNIMPMPSYLKNVTAKFEKLPYAIAKSLCQNKENRHYVDDIVEKTTTRHARDGNLTPDEFKVTTAKPKNEYPILIIDDLFGTGQTVNIVAKKLRTVCENDIIFITMTCNRRGTSGQAKASQYKVTADFIKEIKNRKQGSASGAYSDDAWADVSGTQSNLYDLDDLPF
jgi:hypothetical protein